MFKPTMQELLNIEKINSLKIHLNQNQKIREFRCIFGTIGKA
jgi:hypothetical protein